MSLTISTADVKMPTVPVALPETASPAVGTMRPALRRLVSLDAYRGFVMFLMVAEVWNFSRLGRAFSDNPFWQFLASQQSHRDWVGCSLHDLIQPSFTFMVGVAMPFSIASRMAKGQTFGSLFGHAIWRSLVLIFLGIFLRSLPPGHKQLNFTFEDTLTQIGLGYSFAFLLAFAKRPAQWIALAVILIGYWAAWALYPLPDPNFNWQTVGVAADWPHHLSGFARHWEKNWNFGTGFDQWFMNLFPRERPYLFNGGGYLTLSFIPTLGTMLFGLIAGQWMKSDRGGVEKLKLLLAAGVACLVLGTALHFAGVCPIVKRIWTPTWTIFSAGWTFLLLAGFYAIIDLKGYRAWAFPLVVIGMNSIAIYCMAHLIDGFIVECYKVIFGQNIYKIFGDPYTTLVSGTAVILTLWLILYWMYRRQIFLKI